MLAAAIASPTALGVTSADDLCRAMRTPAAASVACTRGLDRVLRHDVELGLLEVQAGVPWGALAAVRGAQSFRGTVGRSVAENLPGPDGQPLVAHVRALTLATADGQLRRASRERAPELFRLAVGGMGAFGPFYSLTLDLASLALAHDAGVEPVRLPLRSAELSGPRYKLELLLPPESADAITGRVRDAIAERRCTLARMEARRALPEDITLLRWARRDYIALRLEFCARATLGASVAAAQLRTRLIDLAIEAGGSFMPASLPAATRAQAEACYPMLGEFLGEQHRLDPEDRLGTAWTRGAGRVWRAERCRVRFGRP
jgi:FAD/FMN-containing dehydrogenase